MKPPVEAESSPYSSLDELMDKQPEYLRDLFAKVINLYAGYQFNQSSDSQLRDRVRKEIEASCIISKRKP